MKRFMRRVLANPVDPELDDLDEVEEEEGDEDEEEEEEMIEARQRRPLFGSSRIIRIDDDPEELSEEMAAAIRAGEYKPKRSDPWSAHTLYNVLKDLGDL